MVAINCWLIWKARIEKVFKNKNFNMNSYETCLKNESLSYCINYNIVTTSNSSLWFVDPREAVSNILIMKISKFITEIFQKYDLVAFSDESWN